MKKPDKKALKSAGLITVIAVHHGILAAAALLLGVSAFLRERRKKESSYANNF